MVLIHGTHASPSSGRAKTKKASVQMCAAQSVSCSKQEQISTLCTLGWSWLQPFCAIILVDGVH